MKAGVTTKFAAIGLSGVLCIGPAWGQTQGWTAVRVQDNATSHCVDRTKEDVTLDVRRLQVVRNGSWFVADNQVDLLLNVRLEGRTIGKPETQKLALPRAYSGTLKNADNGLVSTGFEESVINHYPLKSGTDSISMLHVDVSLTNESGRTTLTNMVMGLLKVTEALPIPAGPFQAALGYADKYANALLDNSITRADADPNAMKIGSLQFNFSGTGSTCNATSLEERTGTKALVAVVKGREADGVVDLNQPDSYCFGVVAQPIYHLTFRRKSGVTDSCVDGPWTTMRNPYLSLVLNADPLDTKGLAPGLKVSAESVKRCLANGVAAKDCNAEHRRHAP